MSTVTLWIAAKDLNDARRRAYAIDRGIVPMADRYASEEAANAWSTELAAVHHCRLPVFAVVMEHRTVDDGRITNVWVVDKIGDTAAAFLLFVAIPFLLASFWGCLS